MLLVGRKERLEDLRSDLKATEDRIASMNACKQDKDGMRRNIEGEMSSLEERVHAEEIALANIRVKKDSHEENYRKLEDELELLVLESDESRQAIQEFTSRGEALNAELNEVVRNSSLSQQFINDSQTFIAEKRTLREQLSLEIATLRAELQSADREEDNIRNNAMKEEALIAEFASSRESKDILLKEYACKVDLLKEEISQLNIQNEMLSKELNALNEETSTVERSRSDIIDKLSINELQLKEKEKEAESLRNQARDLDVKLTELSYKKNNLKDRILQAYKVDLETTHIELEDSVDWEAIKTQVVELKEKLEKMGPVNLVAIEEHKELEERSIFLTHQQEDLVNAKESLLKAIQKINKTTKELFIETFQKIQVEFKNFYKMLFGGGQAELVLIDEQDVLESGIEIIVRPPGKKLQNIMLLSGGEKALTAIALLFAIFKVKPSPFCVLDEIDAPLDESNVLRFSSVLKDFMKISQFIIITHNKRTIELADVMYGITMQERGVSKIVSVKFLEDKKKPQEEAVAASPVPAA